MGNALELAINVALAHYRRAGRADIRKQEVGRTFGGAFRSRAPVDYQGVIPPGRAVVLEAKMCAESSFPVGPSHIKERQLDALRNAARMLSLSYLVISMTAYQEIYRIDFDVLEREFLAAPYRASLSIHWLRAFAEVVPVSSSPKRAAWILDTRDHDEKATAYLAIAAERAKHAGERVELFPVEVKFRRRVNAEKMPPPGTDEYRERIRNAMEAGIDRQLRGRRKSWNQRRKGSAP